MAIVEQDTNLGVCLKGHPYMQLAGVIGMAYCPTCLTLDERPALAVREALAWIKSQPDLDGVVLTTLNVVPMDMADLGLPDFPPIDFQTLPSSLWLVEFTYNMDDVVLVNLYVALERNGGLSISTVYRDDWPHCDDDGAFLRNDRCPICNRQWGQN